MKTRNLVRCALFAALISVCAWLSIPMGSISFTMQTFAIFLTLMTLGGKWGTVSVFVYLLLGVIGLPVFSGFRGGFGVLLGPTGGYIWGFLGSALIYWLTEKAWNKPVISCALGLLVCYGAGTVWYATYIAEIGFAAALLQCVVPFILPDAAKLLLAAFLSRRIKQYMNKQQ